eukprot:PhF_6_TR18603/c0_g1_i1/m.27182
MEPVPPPQDDDEMPSTATGPPQSPCEHNDWLILRLRKAWMQLACRVCGVRHRAERRFACSTFIHMNWCGNNECKLLHVFKARKGAQKVAMDDDEPPQIPVVTTRPVPRRRVRQYCEMCGEGNWSDAGCKACGHQARVEDENQCSSGEDLLVGAENIPSFLMDSDDAVPLPDCPTDWVENVVRREELRVQVQRRRDHLGMFREVALNKKR